MQTDFLSQVFLPLSLFIIMLGMGLSLTLADFSRVLKAPKAALIGICCQMLLLPIVAYVLIIAMGISGELAVGLMILAFCPGGVTSNMYCYLFKADVALSITLTSIVSVVTPFTIPVLTLLAMDAFMGDQQQFTISVGKVIVQLVVITLVPVAIGMWIFNRYPHFAQRLEKGVKPLSIALLVLILVLITIKDWDNIPMYAAQAGIAAFSLNVVTLALGYLIAKLARLNRAEAMSIGTEVGLQNGTLALLVSGTILGSSIMTIPAVTYSLIMFFTGAAFGWLMNLEAGPVNSGSEQSA
ncbi:bile acid:sodium symporter family protein [Teredinibacter sp. KSP-S5-2]|uniref:bile acid:sodium symporter family protein n=1 Tax=Teredinibacter sp. KSP-S5-2 TaxID=3034506 RepID=UPI002934D749|nr:bile acid:sodium symporter family protein [Teredinibacter sp. KSP-S5-2]WNO07790.1 bile acid:sodium symporter family protein [Teredinibacter sp. KSP-S5-2]